MEELTILESLDRALKFALMDFNKSIDTVHRIAELKLEMLSVRCKEAFDDMEQFHSARRQLSKVKTRVTNGLLNPF